MNSIQSRVLELCNSAEPKENLKKWTRGYIPKHYKRLNISMQEAKRLAVTGATEALSCFGTNLYFTQSLIFGAVIEHYKSHKYNQLVIVTTSQYGKSYTMGEIAIWIGANGHTLRVSGGTDATTEIIMSHVTKHIQNAHQDIKNKLIVENQNKIEKLETAVSRKKLSFKGGGSIESVTLGVSSSNDPKKGNRAIGRGGDYILDEAGLVPDDAYAEIGRREFSNVDGEKDLLIQISNPHREGTFYDKLTDENPPEDTLIIWMDARTAIEEGRIKDTKQVQESDFFRNKSTCQRYLLCELENYSDESMFNNIRLDDSPLKENYLYFLGVDSAYKGKDNIDVCLSCLDEYGNIRILDIETIKKGKWVDGKTSEEILKEILRIQNRVHAKFICVDIGWGVYIVEGLAKKAKDYTVLGINFGGGTTKQRKDNNHYSAKYGANMRAEMYIDLQQLMDAGKVTMTTKVAKVLKKQMQFTKSTIKSGGKIAIIPKDEIKAKIGHSPDELDCCVLSVHSIMLYNMNGGIYVYTQNDLGGSDVQEKTVS